MFMNTWSLKIFWINNLWSNTKVKIWMTQLHVHLGHFHSVFKGWVKLLFALFILCSSLSECNLWSEAVRYILYIRGRYWLSLVYTNEKAINSYKPKVDVQKEFPKFWEKLQPPQLNLVTKSFTTCTKVEALP